MAQDFVNWCSELLAPLGPVRIKRMFGGHGLYVDEIFIALVAGETLYLKVDGDTRAQFEAAGCRLFEYTFPGGMTGHLNYFSAPDDAMDSPAQMQPWARLAMASALRARAIKASPKPRAKPAARASKVPRKAASKPG
ncbi:MAG: TfoX/Sxy family protein [Vitreoscilla sp.]|nr:TfoX/Sxy family protein [Vitreoscilla sp.]